MAIVFELIANFVLEMLMWRMSLRAWLWMIGVIVVAFLLFAAYANGLFVS